MNPILEKRLFRVTRNRTLTPDAFELTLEPADDKPMFPFKAGQWVYLYLLNDDGSEWARAAFSIASAPTDSASRFDLAVKVYGDYTKRAQTLKEGDTVRIQGPFGLFVPKEEEAPLVMYAAGIGVTPFMSMIREELAHGCRREMVLFYTNKTTSDISYEKELRELAGMCPIFKVVFAVTRESPDGWDGEVRRIDADIIRANVDDPEYAEHLMCGTNEFMDAVAAMLTDLGVDIKARLRKERFS